MRASSAAGSRGARPPGSSPGAASASTSTRCARCVTTPVHQTGDFAELVCSNSLRGNALDQAAGLLKEEMRRHGLADHPRRRRGAGPRRQRPRRGPRALRPARSPRPSRPCPASGSIAARCRASPTTPSRSSPRVRSPRRAWPREIAAFVGRGPSPLLRRREPGRGGRHHRLREGLPGLALRQGRRRLRQLPPHRGASTAPSSWP